MPSRRSVLTSLAVRPLPVVDGAGDGWEAVDGAPVGEHEGVQPPAEEGGPHLVGRYDPRCRLAERGTAPHDRGARIEPARGHQPAKPTVDAAEGRRRSGIGKQIAGIRIGKAEQETSHRDTVRPPILRGLEAYRAGQRDQLIDALVHVEDVGIDAIDPIGDDADPADGGAPEVERQSAGIGGQTQGRTARPDADRLALLDQVPARELAELDTEQGPRRLAALAGIEELLDDLVRGAGAEGVPLARQISCGDGLGDGREGDGTPEPPSLDLFEAGVRELRQPLVEPTGRDAGEGPRTVHLKHRQHVAHAIGHRDGGPAVTRPGLRHGLGDDALNLGRPEKGAGFRARAGAITIRRLAGLRQTQGQ